MMNIFKRISSRFTSTDERFINRRNLSISIYSSGTAGNLAGGNFLTGLLLLLNADDAFMGLVTIISMLGNVLQVFSSLILERFPKRKHILIIARGLIHLFNIVIIGLIPVLHIKNQGKLLLVIITIMLISMVNALSSPGFMIWHIKSIPEGIRARYFSFLSITNNIIIYSIVLGSSVIADKFKNSGNGLQGLLLLRLAAVLFAVLDIIFLFKIKEYPNEQDGNAMKLLQILISPFKEKKYLITVSIACLWNFTANLPGPYYNIYLLKDLGVSYSYLNIINMLNIPILIILTPLWAKRIRDTSWFKTLCFSMGIYLLNFVGLSFVSSKTMILYPISMVFAFIFAPGINLTFANIPFINIPQKNQTNYIGFYATMTSLAALLGVTFSRKFISLTENFKINVFGIQMGNKQYLMIVTALLMILAVIIIYFLQKRTTSGQEINKNL
ncbi:MAG: MFS transporter [Clostridiales bacterium]|nr:MFS transporter [Clostridiales bacterium]